MLYLAGPFQIHSTQIKIKSTTLFVWQLKGWIEKCIRLELYTIALEEVSKIGSVVNSVYHFVS